MDEKALEPCRPRKRLRDQCSSAGMDVDYDVFLNHRGPDVKAGFIAHLHDALGSAGLNPFLDKKSLVKGDPAMACPKLLRLDLSGCLSTNTLPNSIGRLSTLRVLNMEFCMNLQKLPSSIGQLTALEVLRLRHCASLEALPDTVTALSGLQCLYIDSCNSISKLPTTIGLMTSPNALFIDLATEWYRTIKRGQAPRGNAVH